MSKESDGVRLTIEGMPGGEEESLRLWLNSRARKPFSKIESWWRKKLVTGDLLLPGKGWLLEVQVDVLAKDYVAGVWLYNVSPRGSATAMGRFLFKVCPTIKTSIRKADIELRDGPDGQSRIVNRRTRFYHIPNLPEARRLWCEGVAATDWEAARLAVKAARAAAVEAEMPEAERIVAVEVEAARALVHLPDGDDDEGRIVSVRTDSEAQGDGSLVESLT